MNLSPQFPVSEEPEQQPVLHSAEETPKQPSPASDSLSEKTEQHEETEQQSANSVSEDIPTLPASSFEPLAEGTEQQFVSSSEPNETEASALDEDEVAPWMRMKISSQYNPYQSPLSHRSQEYLYAKESSSQ